MSFDVSLSWRFPCEVRHRCRQAAIRAGDLDEPSDAVLGGAGRRSFDAGREGDVVREAERRPTRKDWRRLARPHCAAERVRLRVQEILPLGALFGARSLRGTLRFAEMHSQ
jgi:hypothetical protein